MTKKIFRSILAAALTVLAVCLVMVMACLTSCCGEVERDRLKTALDLAAQGVETSGRAYLEGLGTPECRLTWVSPDGTVLYDTQADAGSMENHAGREEIRQALETGEGTSSRLSSTLTRQTTYYARRLTDGTVLRASADSVTALALLLWMFQPILFMAVIAVILSALLARRMARQIVEPINRLDLDDPLSNDVYEELAPLLRRIHRQWLQIDAQLSELRARADEFEQIAGSMSEALVLLDKNGTVLSINPAARRLFRAGGDCVGRDFLTLDLSPGMSGAIRRALTEGSGEFLDEREGRTWQFHVSRIQSGEETAGAVALAFDVTDRAQAEERRREFTANVSHELKTPLQSILGSAELLESGMVKEEDAPRFVGRIRSETGRLLALIDDILRLSELDENAPMPRGGVDLHALAGEVAAALREKAQARNVRMSVAGESAVVNGVRPLLHEMLYNLCDNAVKYNVEGGEVEIAVTPGESEAAIAVRDTGIGIPLEYQDRVFERFFRVDKSRSKASGGTGLGLSIVKHAVLYHGGRIRLESAPGQGTTVTVSLPARPAEG